MTIKEIKEEILSVRMEIDRVYKEYFDSKTGEWVKNSIKNIAFRGNCMKYWKDFSNSAQWAEYYWGRADVYHAFLYRKLRNLQLKLNREFWKKFRKTP